MPRWSKLLIGLAAALFAVWIWHAPVGTGAAFVGEAEAQARAAVERTEVPGVELRIARDPLGRLAILSGPADRFQRDGRGEFPGINRRVERIPGVSGVHWTDERPSFYMPLLAEAMIAAAIAYLIGLGAGRLVFGRRRRLSYLD